MSDLPYTDLLRLQLCRLIKRHLGLRVLEVKPEDRLIEDLHCDSLDLVEIPNAIEELNDIEISDEEAAACSTVAHYVALTARKLREKGR